MPAALFAAVLGTGCASDEDVVGPFSGPVRRYVVEAITLVTGKDVQAISSDLDGDGSLDNQLSYAIGWQKSYGMGGT